MKIEMINQRNRVRVFYIQRKLLVFASAAIKKLISIVGLFRDNIQHKAFYKLQKRRLVENQVFLESSHGKSFGGNMLAIARWLSSNRDEVKIFISSRDVVAAKKILEEHSINAKVVSWYSIEYMAALATSKFVFNDTSFYPFFTKRSGQIYINTWHGTPLKKLGLDAGSPAEVGNVMKNLLLSDFIWVSNEYTQEKLSDSFKLKGVFQGKYIIGPSPRNQVLYDCERGESTKKSLGLVGKKIIVYMPTWRDAIGVGKRVPSSDPQVKLIEYLSSELPENFVLVYKLHDYVSGIELGQASSNAVECPKWLDAYDLLCSSSMLITDYSSVMFDYCGTGKPIALFTYDEEDYIKTRGVYLKASDLGFFSGSDPSDLLSYINKSLSCGKTKCSPSPVGSESKLKKHYCPFDGKPIDCLMRDILGEAVGLDSQGDYILKEESLNKHRIGFFSGALWDNGITVALFNLLEEVAGKESKEKFPDVTIFFNRSQLQRDKLHKIKSLPEGVRIYPVLGKFQGGGFEKILYYSYMKFEFLRGGAAKLLVSKLYRREFDRTIGALGFNHIVHYTGYDRNFAAIIGLGASCKKSIYIHSDMVKEYKAKKNFSRKHVFEAYKSFDNVILVSEKLRESAEKDIKIPSGKILVAPNFLGRDRVKKLSKISLRESMEDARVFKFSASLGCEEIIKEEVGDDVREELCRSLEDPCVKSYLNIGRVSPEKGQVRLVEAFSDVLAEHKNVKLIIMGAKGSAYHSLRKAIAMSRVFDSIFYVEHVNNPYPVMLASDCVVVSSMYEGQGLVALEAMILKKDVISVDLPVLKKFLFEYGTIVDNSKRGLSEGFLLHFEKKISSKRELGDEIVNEADRDAEKGMRDVFSEELL